MRAFFSSRTFLVSASITGAIVYLGFAHPIGNLVGKLALLVVTWGLFWALSRWEWLSPTPWKRQSIACVIGLLILAVFLVTNSFEKFGKLSENIVAFPADVLWQVLSCTFQIGLGLAVAIGLVWLSKKAISG